MTNITPPDLRKTKLKFFSAYVISVFFILVLFASIWQGDSAASASEKTYYPDTNGQAYVQADYYLHKRMLELNNMYSSFMSNSDTSSEKLIAAESAFKNSLDSIQTEVSSMQNDVQQKEWNLLLESFRKILDNSTTMSSYARIKNDSASFDRITASSVNSSDSNNVALGRLKMMLNQKEEQIAYLERRNQTAVAEKDRTILSLQSRISQNNGSVLPKSTAEDAGWKQKFIQMKSRHAELNSSYNNLSQSYQNVVADNRRLLNQLQLKKTQ